ncbi:hypothetical protein C8Q70DRAFT_198743 [Cubamyces menziesii]|nr:hypothetical protein C8Q70DRAFT_198743 [Cubamyces menziesii]
MAPSVRFRPYTLRQRDLISGRAPVPLRPRDLRPRPPRPEQTARYATPAEELVEALLFGKTLDLHESDFLDPSDYNNFEIEVRGKTDGVFQDSPTYTLAIHLKPMRYMRALTVTLESWNGVLPQTGHDSTETGAPSWTWGIKGVLAPKYVKCEGVWSAWRVRNYLWVWEFISRLFLAQNRRIPALSAWVRLWEYVDDLKARDRVASRIAAAAARGASNRPRPRPRPVPSSRDLILPFTALTMNEGGDAGQETDTLSSVRIERV